MACPHYGAAVTTSAVLDPRRGWAQADGPRRVLALALAPALALWSALTARVLELGQVADGVLMVLLPVAVVPMAYSAARVLRPYRRAPSTADLVRHWVAAVGSGLGLLALVSILLLRLDGDSSRAGLYLVLVGLGPLACVLVALPWGVVAALLPRR